ncbi:MAG: hypothetical protein IT178_05045 [Acidobacteria bacterium]|nr:hypothetical protein [Acidobacteriota bacterium]
MPCTQFPPDAAERYAAGTMAEPERSAFEDHFFDCETCFAGVQAAQALAAALHHNRTTPGATVRGAARSPRPWLALAAVLVLAVAAVALWRASAAREPEPQTTASLPAEAPPAATPVEPVDPPAPPAAPSPAPDSAATPPSERRALIAQLALFTPPVYLRLPSRGAPTDADAVDAALAGYSDRQYDRVAAALTRLLPTLTGEPASRAAFYLGIVELLRGRVAEGQAALVQAVQADVPPYSDEAHFYLAKAALAAGNEAVAHDELTMAINAEAGPEGEAARMLAQLSRR